MAGGKLPPRQKMIGMMYLVLLALLAMNVSKSILEAFVVVNDSLEDANKNYEQKNAAVYDAFAKAEMKEPAKVKIYHERAQKAKKMVSELVTYVDELKHMMYENIEGKTKAEAKKLKLQQVENKDNYDAPSHLLGVADPAAPKGGKNSSIELKGKVKKLREELLKLFNEDVPGKKLFLPNTQKAIDAKLALKVDRFMEEDGIKFPWEVFNFYHRPLAAVITNLTNIQLEARNAEADVISELFKAVSGMDFKFDRLQAKVIAPSSYIIAGDKYTADVLLVASNSASKPMILTGQVDTAKKTLLGEGKPLEVVGGMGKYEMSTSSEGLQKWGGVIKMEKPDGTFDQYPFTAEYMVAKPSAAVSLDKMNVFYIGVDNPVSVSAAGVAPDDLVVSGGNCNISGSKGKYTVRVSAGTEATITVSAKIGGGNKPMGPPFKYRVKRVPDPVTVVGGKKGDDIMTKAEASAIAGIIPRLENFDFDLKFDVMSFDLSYTQNGLINTLSATGNACTAAMKTALASVKPGSRIYFENVKVKGPDGSIRKIPGVGLKIR